MNERDSEAIAAQLIQQGYSLADSEETADILLINTCSVRDAAEQKALGTMRSLGAALKERRPEVILGFMGCMAQAQGEELQRRIPFVDLVVGTQKAHRIPELLRKLDGGKGAKICEIAPEEHSQDAIREHLAPLPGQPPTATAFVSIMQGCNQHCTFCIVPATRGPERSRSIPDIVDECRELAARGVKEITLLGQIVTSFGRRELPLTNGKSPFVQLLDAVHEIDGIERIRFTAPHPKGYGDDLIEAFARLPKLCESAHLPIQSGSDRVLKLMHRGYSTERVLDLIEKLRKTQPRISVVTDLIAGFPGETEEDFQQTLTLVRTAQFDNAYVYKYSPRRDTPAAASQEQVPPEIREERHSRLLNAVNEIALPKYEAFVGKTTQVLVEGPSRKNSARAQGRTRCNRLVLLDHAESCYGSIISADVTRAGKFTLYAHPIEEPGKV